MIENAELITHILIGAIIFVSVLVSIINVSSPISMWFIINQFQMLMLLLLTRAYMPKRVRQYLTDMNIVLFNFNFIPVYRISLIYDLYLWIKFDHNDDDLKDIGVKSGSTIVNNISTIAILILFAIIHMTIA